VIEKKRAEMKGGKKPQKKAPPRPEPGPRAEARTGRADVDQGQPSSA
jgi:hypothetical protein